MQDEEDDRCCLGQSEEPLTPGTVEQFKLNTSYKTYIYDNTVDTRKTEQFSPRSWIVQVLYDMTPHKLQQKVFLL